MYVGSAGLESTRSFEVGLLQSYVKNLCRLAIACIVLRVIWVINISIDVKREVDENNEKARESLTNPDPDPDQPVPHIIDRKVVGTIELQVSVQSILNFFCVVLLFLTVAYIVIFAGSPTLSSLCLCMAELCGAGNSIAECRSELQQQRYEKCSCI